MIAKVVSGNREYYSHVFAMFNPGWHQCVVVFDSENEKFELLNVYKTMPYLKRKVFIIDTDKTDMIEQKEIKISVTTKYENCVGYSWILENHDLIKSIKARKTVDEKYIQLAVTLNNSIDTGEWKYVKSQKDAENLLSASWGFHDATLANISYKVKENYDEPSIVQVLFTGCWECDILLEFKKDVLVHFNVNDNNTFEILDSNIIFHDGFIYWVDDCIENVSDITEEYIYFRARSLAWKMVVKNE